MRFHRTIARGVGRVPGLKRVPVIKLLFLAEILVLAKRHLEKLSQEERQQLFILLRKGRNITQAERQQLIKLIRLMEPRAFAGQSLDILSPVPMPNKITKKK
jgi:hypothetical protein